MVKTLTLRTDEPSQFINITSEVQKVVSRSGIADGLCTVYVPHTTAGVTVNEAADPTVVRDLIKGLSSIVPFQGGYLHSEGNSAAHIKSSLMGVSSQLPVADGRLQLGTWQGIFFCEFDGPRNRQIKVSVVDSGLG